MPNTPPEVLTRYLDRKDRAFAKSRNAANASNKANKRVKSAFYNTINNTLNNHTIPLFQRNISPRRASNFSKGMKKL